MEVGNFWRVLLRRWQLTAAAIVLVVGATYLAASGEGPTYKSEGSVLLLPPGMTGSNSTSAESANPYLALGGLTQARDVVVRALSARSEAEEFGRANPGVSYTATPDFTTGSPIVVLTVEAPGREAGLVGLDQLMQRVLTILNELQTDLDIPTSTYITSTVLTQDTTPAPILKYQVRAALTAGGGTAMVCLLLIGLIDGLLLSGRLRRKEDRAGADEEDPGTAAGDEAVAEDDQNDSAQNDEGPGDDGHDSDDGDDGDDRDSVDEEDTEDDGDDEDDEGRRDSTQVDRPVALSPVRSVATSGREARAPANRSRRRGRGRNQSVRDAPADDAVALRYRGR